MFDDHTMRRRLVRLFVVVFVVAAVFGISGSAQADLQCVRAKIWQPVGERTLCMPLL
jgi:hypothetical protein